ncbi:hypothetical protein [Mesorhizobium sp.]
MAERPADPASHLYKRHRFPAEIISHAVWLHFRFPLSLRHVEDILAVRDIAVSLSRPWVNGQPSSEPANGTSMGWSFPSRAGNTGCGERSMQTAMFSTPLCKAEEAVKLR